MKPQNLSFVPVLIATAVMTAYNYFAAAGYVNGVTPAAISAKLPTLLTPAGYAFSIWTLIYAGLLGFGIHGSFSENAERFRQVRTLYILTCVLNCAWIFFWHRGFVGVCFVIILALMLTLYYVNLKLHPRGTLADLLLVSAPLGLYFGWVSVAAIANFAALLVFTGIVAPNDASTRVVAFSTFLILLAAAMGILVRVKLNNYFYPLAIAWGLTGIAVKQSGHTLIVVAAAVGVVICLITCLSFVVNLPSQRVITPK
ncbi:MAG: TspO/MBR family protein [Pyrinomonadaceae bacterium]